MPLIKNVVSVPGFYKAMKKTSHANANVSMDCDSPIQVTVNHGETKELTDQNRDDGSDPTGVGSPIANYDAKLSVFPHKVTTPATQCEDNCVIIRDITHTTDPYTKLKGFDTQLKDIEDELSRFDFAKTSHLIFFGLDPRDSPTLPNLA